MKKFGLILAVVSLLFLNSCKDKPFDKFFQDQFPEINNVDGMIIDGSFAVPLLDSYFTLEDFFPSTDSSLWAEVDENDIVHLRMYFKDAVVFTAKQIYPQYYPNDNSVAPQGTLFNADSASGVSDWNKLKVYENALDGHLFFDDPRITFIFKNQIPIVTFFRLDSLKFRRANGEILADYNVGKYTIEAPTSPGETRVSSVRFTKTEIPNLEYMFEPIPKRLSVGITAGSDQNQQLPYDVPATYKISCDVDVDLPLIAHLRELVIGDTADFSLAEENPDEIEAITLKMIIDNELPVSGIAQIVFVDSNYNEIMRLFDGEGWYFASSEVNAQGETVKAIRSEIVKTISQDDVKTLKDNNVAYAIFTGTFNSPIYNNDSEFDVKIYGWYKLRLKLGLKFDYKVDTQNLPQ